MPRNGSGTASKAISDFVTGNTASATDMNTLIDDLISMLTGSVAKDGQTVLTGDIDFNGNKIVLDVDGDTKIYATTDDQIDIDLGGSNVLSIDATLAGVLGNTTASFTTADETKLDGIESNATADQTGAEIATALFAESDTNNFTDADHSKLDGIEASADVTDAANVVSALSGATLSGSLNGGDKELSRVNLKDYGEVTNAIGSIGGGTQDIDLTSGNSVTATVDTSTTTFTFSNPTASDEGCGFILKLTNGGSQTVNWPASVDWNAATAPTLTASGVDVLAFYTWDAGTTWYGFVLGQAMA